MTHSWTPAAADIEYLLTHQNMLAQTVTHNTDISAHVGTEHHSPYWQSAYVGTDRQLTGISAYVGTGCHPTDISTFWHRLSHYWHINTCWHRLSPYWNTSTCWHRPSFTLLTYQHMLTQSMTHVTDTIQQLGCAEGGLGIRPSLPTQL
jgi:hypothetical protein